MPSVTFLVGLPYSGKSTFLKNINADFTSTDQYIEEYANEEGISYQDSLEKYFKKAEHQMYEDVVSFVKHESSFWWDQTNLTPESRMKKLAYIPKDWQRNALVFNTNFGVIFKRRDLRPEKVIPDKVLLDMFLKFKPPTLSEGFNNIYTIENTGE